MQKLRNMHSLRGVYNSFREGGIVKYQNPSSGIQRRDVIQDDTCQLNS